MPVNDDYDAISDELIEIIINNASSDAEKARASKDLFERHNDWVNKQISGSVFDPDDRRDVAQVVWMMVLPADKLRDSYTKKGKFRAYLRAPIRWAILKHIDKLPFSTDKAGNKVAIQTDDATDDLLNQGLHETIVQSVISDIVKPGLKNLEIKSRNVYMLNEHPVIFESSPDVAEAAELNGTELATAKSLLASAKCKIPAECDVNEQSILIPVEYENFINPEEMGNATGRYLSSKIGITEAQFRKRLHTAKTYFVNLVRENMPENIG